MSCDELKTLYLHYHKAYDQKTYKGGDIPQRTPTHKFA